MRKYPSYEASFVSKNDNGLWFRLFEGRCTVRTLDSINMYLRLTVWTNLGCRSCRRCRFLQLVDHFHKQENNKSQDQKLNDVLNKTAIGKLNSFNIFKNSVCLAIFSSFSESKYSDIGLECLYFSCISSNLFAGVNNI